MGSLVKLCVRSLAGCAVLLVWLPAAFSVPPPQKQDYLTDDEIEQLREAQEPAERIKLLDDFLKERLAKARALKSPPPVSAGESKSTVKKDKGSSSKDAKKEPPASSSPSPQESHKSFAVLMGEYLQCLEEISSNVENFSSYKVEPKTYLKSLKGLDQSLQEHRKWITEISGKLNRSEKEIVADVSEALGELSADVNEGIQRANNELKLLKESRKAKSE